MTGNATISEAANPMVRTETSSHAHQGLQVSLLNPAWMILACSSAPATD